MDQYKKNLELRLVDETTKANLSVKDSIEYVVKYFHRLGNTDFKMSQSSYEKLRHTTKQMPSEDGTIQLLQKPEVVGKISDLQKIDEIVEIYFENIRKHAIREDIPDNIMKHLHNTTDEVKPQFDKDWQSMNKSTELIVKLLRLKYKL